FKPMAQPSLDYREVSYSVETTLMTEDRINSLELIRSQPILLQRYIEKCYELRVTCVGDDIFVATQTLEISATDAPVDWRTLQMTDSSSFVAGSLPQAVVNKIRVLLRRLNLGFAAMDFAVDQDGNHFFLEVNPNGQWLGYTEEIGLPAAASVARYLVEKPGY